MRIGWVRNYIGGVGMGVGKRDGVEDDMRGWREWGHGGEWWSLYGCGLAGWKRRGGGQSWWVQ